jgi:UDP-N-acetylmuramoylalanine--D-glutamate ligase
LDHHRGVGVDWTGEFEDPLMDTNQTDKDKTLIVGLGKTGLSCARYLARRGADFAVIDSRQNPPGLAALREQLPGVAVFLGGFAERPFAAADRLLVSPGVSLLEPPIRAARERGVEVIGDIELFAREVCGDPVGGAKGGLAAGSCQAPVVAITGSNGKSTVTMLTGAMARAAGLNVALGGNLGTPALDLLAPEVDLYVLEISSFQLETTQSLKARAAVVLNVSQDHLDRYPSLEAYAATKAVIYQGAQLGVINRDDPKVEQMAGIPLKQIGFTLHEPPADDFGIRSLEGVDWLCQGSHPLLPTAEIHIAGRHNLANALAALALSRELGLPLEAMRSALQNFTGLPHRMQFVAEKRQLRWYNDSKGTNPGATIAALNGMHPAVGDSRTVLIAGGDCKGADFSPLVPVVQRTARAVILIGRDAPRLEAVLHDRVRLAHVSSLPEAIEMAVQLSRPGDRVLLSPACASFDMFRNFEARGEAFIQAVEALAA